MEIVRYTQEHKKEWDAFVDASKNGTFLLKRDYMDYHADRFTDCSFLFYEKNKLVALLPANIDEETHTLHSHQGLTYAGFIMKKDITVVQVLEIFDDFLPFVNRTCGIKKMIYKAIPFIYSTYPAEEDLYALFRHDAKLTERKISSAILMESPLPFKQSRKGGVSKARRNGLAVLPMKDFESFWNILNDTLVGKHQAKPVHTCGEMLGLAASFPKNIYGFEVRKERDILAGCLVYETKNVAHIQYISANEEGKELGALDLLFDYLIKEYFGQKKYFEFGVSVEQGGWYLNEGLIFQKEGFGARGIVYDTYELNVR